MSKIFVLVMIVALTILEMYFWKDSTVAGGFLRTKNHITEKGVS
jgi:hypothetical protein